MHLTSNLGSKSYRYDMYQGLWAWKAETHTMDHNILEGNKHHAVTYPGRCLQTFPRWTQSSAFPCRPSKVYFHLTNFCTKSPLIYLTRWCCEIIGNIYILVSALSSWHRAPKTLVKGSTQKIFCSNIFSARHKAPRSSVISWVIGSSDTELLSPLEFGGW